jgi:gluconokinase
VLAQRLNLTFVDADDLHSPESVKKMAAGVPLDEQDRLPWLARVGDEFGKLPRGIVACSALARRYRDLICERVPDVVFIELMVGKEELRRRLSEREHFMPASLLESQISLLEPLTPDENGLRVQNSGTVDEVAGKIVEFLLR